MKISFKEYVEYRDSKIDLQEGLRDTINNAWTGLKNWWSQKPSQASASGTQVQNPAASPSREQPMKNRQLEKERRKKLSRDADEALSRLDQPHKDAAKSRNLISDLKQRLISNGVDPKILSDAMLKGYVDEILSTTRQGGQRDKKIQQIINSLKSQGGTQQITRPSNAGKPSNVSAPSNVGTAGAEMAKESLMQVAQAFGGKFPSNWKASIKIKKDGTVYLSLIDPNGMSRDYNVNQKDDMIHLIQSYANADDDGANPQYNYIRSN